jgi:hypothetical protein
LVAVGFIITSPYGPEIRKWLKHGIGINHAGLPPKYSVLIEQHAPKGPLKIICGTDVLAPLDNRLAVTIQKTNYGFHGLDG